MTTLTKYWREKIEDALLEKAFTPRADAIVAKRAEFAVRCYEDFYKPATRLRMEELPEGWLNEDSSIQIYVGTTIHDLNYNGSFDRFSGGDRPKHTAVETIYKRRPYKEHGRKVYERDSKFAKQFAELSNEVNALKADWKKAKQEIRAQLYSYPNFEKLLEAWPEITPVVTTVKSAVERPAGLPVPSTASINKLLGLSK